MPEETEFLSKYNINDYERPSVAADIAAFMIRSEEGSNYKQDSVKNLSVLLIRRGEHPFKDQWALPGGFLRPNETIQDCAFREILEEANVTPVSLMPSGVYSEPGRDPRGWIISNAYVSVISEDSTESQLRGGDDASDAKWFDVSFEKDGSGAVHLDLNWKPAADGAGFANTPGKTIHRNCTDQIDRTDHTVHLGNADTHKAVTSRIQEKPICLKAVLKEEETRFGRSSYAISDPGDLAFDHARIIAEALSVLRHAVRDFEMLFDFLPEKFTLTELQKVQETILNISLLPANFRRKISEYVMETDEYTRGAGHRPAKYYTRRSTGNGKETEPEEER